MDLTEVQKELEQSWLADGIAQYHRITETVPFSATDQGAYILGRAMRDLESSISDHMANSPMSYPIQKACYSLLKPLELGTIVLKYLLDTTFSGQGNHLRPSKDGPKSISSMSIKIGSLVVDHLNYRLMELKAPRAMEYMEEFLKGKTRSTYYRTIRWWKKQLEYTEVTFDTRDKGALGYELLSLAIENTGLFESVRVYCGNRMITTLVPTQEVLHKVLNNLEVLAGVHPRYLPMVVKPQPWTTATDGGYQTLRINVISHHSHNAEHLAEGGFLESRFDCLNRLQDVPWEVNTEILEAMNHAYTIDHPTVPLADLGVQLPPRPWANKGEYQHLKETNPDAIKQWAKRTAVLYAEFYAPRTVGQRMGFLRCLAIARRFSTYTPLYFPWRMDYRGRFYPIPHTLNPQGSDYSKALLRFHQRTPLSPQNHEAWRLYLIQGANLYGIDKVSFDERTQWSRQNHGNIIGSALDPWANQWWSEADKPWCFIAWCMEYQRITSGKQQYTQLPVNRDGKCNGLQHLSVAVRDRATASLVSLVPLDKPSDIYTEVVKATEELTPVDSQWKGCITRAMVKRPTMTTPYNVTQRGMGDQIKEVLVDESTENHATKEIHQASVELRELVHEGIKGLLGKTTELMQWYSDVARVFHEADQPIEWLLPDGFKVIQDIPKTTTKKLKLRGGTVVINYRENLAMQDLRRNTSAFSPNITHSWDAAHMTKWIQQLPPGTPMACVHDSYGLTAPDMALYGDSILGVFVQLYSDGSPIAAIQTQAEASGLTLPDPPSMGLLTMDEISRADYAFA